MSLQPKKFRKKPIVIEAMQFLDNESADAIIEWSEGAVQYDDYEPEDKRVYVLGIATLEGYMLAYKGDWIIRGVKGEFYPCKPDIFKATYDAEHSLPEDEYEDAPDEMPWAHQSPMPGQVYAHVDFNEKPPVDEDGKPIKYVMPDAVANLHDANLITSRVQDSDKHKIILDIDFPVKVIQSTTPGHYHLYIDKEIEFYALEDLLITMSAVGIVEHGYARASIQRGYTAVRLPWIKKEAD